MVAILDDADAFLMILLIIVSILQAIRWAANNPDKVTAWASAFKRLIGK